MADDGDQRPRRIYRMRIYKGVPEQAEVFDRFFLDYLLPVQRRHGAKLVGRWRTDDHRVIAIWAYDDRQAYESIQANVAADPDTRLAMEVRDSLPALVVEREEVFMTSTLDATDD